VQLEELKLRCRGGEAEACRLIVSFCLGHPGVCADLAPSLDPPVTDRPLLENRLRNLLVACDAGDDAACRQVAVGCDRFADLCPADIPVAPRPSSAPSTGPRPGISSGDSVPSSPTPRVGASLDDTAAPTSPAGDATRPAETSTDDRVSTPGPRPTNASSDIATTPAPIVTEAPTTAPSDRPAGDRPR
jgi:hypothetical protein